MTTQFRCSSCGTVTEALEGLCPVCGAAAEPDGDPGQPATPRTAATQGSHAPPTGPNQPAPRRDPYAQFGNPLHSNWGQPVTQQPRAAVQPTPTHSRRKRPWLTRTVVLLVVSGVAVAAWLGRSWLDERWDSFYDTVEGWTGDEGASARTGATDIRVDGEGEPGSGNRATSIHPAPGRSKEPC